MNFVDSRRRMMKLVGGAMVGLGMAPISPGFAACMEVLGRSDSMAVNVKVVLADRTTFVGQSAASDLVKKVAR